ncbi:alpha/beta fold hydrolase [Vibrio sp. WXL103]|uniref:alpha/beta fold hydrolase n=1 Tax=Vibrio sp. WXL103 TaxID=3450710 RepID=UPI003EC7D2EE
MENSSDLGQELTSIIYEAALDYSRWPSLLYTVADFHNKQMANASNHNGYIDDYKHPLIDEPLYLELSKQLDRCLSISERLNYIDSLSGIQQRLLDTLPMPAILLSLDDKICAYNNRATNFIKVTKGVEFSQQRLKLIHLPNQQQLDSTLRKLRHPNRQQEFIEMVWQFDKKPYSVMACQISAPDQRASHQLLLFGDAHTQEPMNITSFAEQYQLTPAETRLLSKLVEGVSLRNYALDTALSINTVRSQLKAIFIKTDCHRQSELIKTVLKSCQQKPNVPIANVIGASSKTSACYHQTLVLPEGQQLSYSDVGRCSGIPVIMLHPTLGSRLQDYGAEALMLKHNIRFICADRPGYGLSSMSGPFTLEAHAKNIVYLADHLGLQNVHLISLWGSTPFALAAAQALKDRVQSVHLISPLSPFKVNKKVNQRATSRLLMYVATRAPLLLKPIVTLMIKGLLANPGQYFEQLNPTLNQSDFMITRQKRIADGFIRACQEAVRHGYEAPTQDFLTLANDWQYLAASTKNDVIIWHGDQDHDILLEQAELLSQSFPSCELRVMRGHGHLLIFSCWEQILTEIKLRHPQFKSTKKEASV